MNDMLFLTNRQLRFRQEQRQATRRERVFVERDGVSMRPWCRRCRTRVDDWRYDRYADGFYGFFVRCHGETMGGLIPYLAPFYGCVLEVFCDDEPRSREGRWFFVGCDGAKMQEPLSYVAQTVRKGAFASTGFGGWARRNQGWLGMIPLAIVILLQVGWRLVSR